MDNPLVVSRIPAMNTHCPALRLITFAGLALVGMSFPGLVRADCVHHLSSSSRLNSAGASEAWAQLAALLETASVPSRPAETGSSPLKRPTPCGPGMRCGGTQDHAPQPTTLQWELPDAMLHSLYRPQHPALAEIASPALLDYTSHTPNALDPPPRNV